MRSDKNIYDRWSEKIIKDLGVDKFNKLFSYSDENIKVSPFYSNNPNSMLNPDKFIFPHNWSILGDIDCNKCTDLNEEIKKLHKNNINDIILYNYAGDKLNKSTVSSGNIFIHSNKYKKIFKELNLIIEPKLDELETLRLDDYLNKKFKINISSEFFKNSGANIIQEIAFTVSVATDLLDRYGINLVDKISFEVVQGNNYFFEIAKIQVLRVIWSLISNEYGKQIDDCIITAKPFIKNKTIKNYNNNIIRSTSECMSGILGGCNYIKSLAYDIKFKNGNDFSERIKYNQLLILKYETHIDKVNNAVSGSYYFSYLIENLAQRSLDLFKKIMSNGGYLESLKDGGLFNEILSNSKKVKEQYKSGKKILVGFNKYINES